MKSEFVSMVSHELRTPLTAIRGSLGLIAGGALGELTPSAGPDGRHRSGQQRAADPADQRDPGHRADRVRDAARWTWRRIEPRDLIEAAVGQVQVIAEEAGVRVSRRPDRGRGVRRCRPGGADPAEPVEQRDQVLPPRRLGLGPGRSHGARSSSSPSATTAGASPRTSWTASSSGSSRSIPPTPGRRAAPGSGCPSAAASSSGSAAGSGPSTTPVPGATFLFTLPAAAGPGRAEPVSTPYAERARTAGERRSPSAATLDLSEPAENELLSRPVAL